MHLYELQKILNRAASLKIMVIGDYFLDHYLIIDETKNELSVETGKTAYQVAQVRSTLGAAGSVVSNLAELGVGEILTVGIIGVDGYGYKLRKLLQEKGVNTNGLISTPQRLTSTYIKPMCGNEELNRLDLLNWSYMPQDLEQEIITTLRKEGPHCDAILVADQVSEEGCGVITSSVRTLLQELGQQNPDLAILVDSRERIGEFTQVMIKPNEFEAARALGLENSASNATEIERMAKVLFAKTGKPVFLTCGENGQWVYDGNEVSHIPALVVEGPIDIVGAGDSTAAAIAIALAGGASHQDAAFFGNLVASITIKKLGTTGTASPEEVLKQFKQCNS